MELSFYQAWAKQPGLFVERGRTMKRLVLAIVLLCVPSMAEARHRHYQQQLVACGGFFQPPCAYQQQQWRQQQWSPQSWFAPFQQPQKAVVVRRRHRTKEAVTHISREPANSIAVQRGNDQIVPHPDGCPRHLFCACGAAVRVFGQALRELWSASSWFRFPHVPSDQAQSGMVAVSRHHVFVLESKLDRDTWMTTDYNSGRGLSRVHAKSIRGYTIVNPKGS